MPELHRIDSKQPQGDSKSSQLITNWYRGSWAFNSNRKYGNEASPTSFNGSA
jgi:hypothetical protein